MDLFPVPPQDSEGSHAESKRRHGSTASGGQASASVSPSPYSPGAQPYPYTFPAPQPPYAGGGMPQAGSSSLGITMLPPMHIPPQPYAQETAPGHGNPPSADDNVVIHYHNGHTITEGSKCTEALAGTTFVQAANLDYKGNKVLMFVFSVRVVPLLCVIFLFLFLFYV